MDNHKENGPKRINKEEFLKDLSDFENLDSKSQKEIFRLAWDSRKFEIELYWKRAVYFWAFQAVALAGYFAIYSTSSFVEKGHALFYINCIGFITAIGWYLSNKGSKSWQRHWEQIVDILEDYTIGKLYKTSTTQRTYSVSKINELISLFFTLMWTSSLLFHLFEKYIYLPCDIDFKILIPLLITIIITYHMFFGRGRGRFGERTVKLYRRITKTE